MKKIAILTFQSLDNYGQRLQNLAVQELLKERTDRVIDSLLIDYGRIPWYRKVINDFLLYIRPKHRALNARIKLFKKFNKEYLNIVKVGKDFKDEIYAYIVLGGGTRYGIHTFRRKN